MAILLEAMASVIRSPWLSLYWLLVLASHVRAHSPLIMSWSDKSFGPDGPWQAVTVSLGDDPKQTVALYPGGRWSCTILTTGICNNRTISSDCYAKSAGLYDSASSSTTNISDPAWKQYNFSSAPGFGYFNEFYDTVNIGNDIAVPNVSMTGVYDAYQTYPGGQIIPVEVGILSLGAPAINHDWVTIMTFIASYVWTSAGVWSTTSYSYGMHIGSAALGIPGSLLLGGYDLNRVVGNVSTQSFTPFAKEPGGNLMISILDIGLGVATGGSPWDFSEKKGLLAQSNSSLSTPFSLEVDPAKPYLYLPRSTCDAITANLPVTFNSSLGLYIWDTTDDRYKTIVTSPAYLSFTFEQDMSNNANLTINVPFALLNLTLVKPIVEEPTPYFPCFPVNSSYTLGRAFLQAAFVGVNYGNGYGNGEWYLGQAPGPRVSDTPQLINMEVDQKHLEGSTNSWEGTWESHWTELPEISASNSTSNSTSAANSNDSGLSTGGKAGVGVGCGIAGVVLIGAVAWVIIRRKRAATARIDAQKTESMASYTTRRHVQQHPQELESKLEYNPHELDSNSDDHQTPVEVPAQSVNWRNANNERYELD